VTLPVFVTVPIAEEIFTCPVRLDALQTCVCVPTIGVVKIHVVKMVMPLLSEVPDTVRVPVDETEVGTMVKGIVPRVNVPWTLLVTAVCAMFNRKGKLVPGEALPQRFARAIVPF